MSKPIAIVTGAAGGIGTEICKHLARRGIAVALLDRDPHASQVAAAALEREQTGSTAGTFRVDLADHADIRRCAAELLARFPAIDYLFNNAGVLTETLTFSTYGNELHFEVNALAPLTLIDTLRPALARARGTVINTSAGISTRATTLTFEDLVTPKTFSKLFGPYVASKEALNALTAALAREAGPDGIVLRAVDPGPTKTRLTKGAGTPLWMRLFAPLLPGPAHGAAKIVGAAFDPAFAGTNGVFISGRVKPLPPAVADPRFQDDLLARCRERTLVA